MQFNVVTSDVLVTNETVLKSECQYPSRKIVISCDYGGWNTNLRCAVFSIEVSIQKVSIGPVRGTSMNNNLDTALRALLTSILREVLEEIRCVCQKSVVARHEKPTTTQPEILLTSREAAKRLAISERHLYTLTHAGELPCVRVGRSIRYSVETIQQWIRDAESETVKQQPPERARSQAKLSDRKYRTVTPQETESTRDKAKRSRFASLPKPNNSGVTQRNDNARPENTVPNLFRRALAEMGIDPASIPPMTNGELMRISETDVPTFHGWMYHNRPLPAEALEKLRNHFLNRRNE